MQSNKNFAEIAQLESAAYIATLAIDPDFALVDLSVQQCIDCASDPDEDAEVILDDEFNPLPPPYTVGHCLEYATTHNIQPVSVYPSRELFEEKQCRVHDQADKGRGKKFQIDLAANEGWVYASSVTYVTPSSETALQTAIEGRPVVVSVQASSSAFQFWSGVGILNSADCGTVVDHSLLAVGFATDGETDYYLAQNSWGTDWGDDGYIKIAVETGDTVGLCGIQTEPVYADITLVDAPSAPEVVVVVTP